MRGRDLRLAIAFVISAISLMLTIIFTLSSPPSTPSISLSTPWQCIGGCGAGGSGGSASDIRWIGRGTGGGLVDMEAVGSLTIGEEFEYRQLRTRMNVRPSGSTQLGLTVPIVSKTGILQPRTNYDDKTEQTAGLGDMMFDISRKIGAEGDYSLLFNLTVPSGRFDIKRGREQEMLYLPVTLQCGTGLFQAAAGIGHTIDIEDGLWIVEGYFVYPFAVNFRGKNRFVNSGADQYNDVYSRWDLLTDEQKRRFSYRFKPYGENDLGRYIPPSLTMALYYGNRKRTEYVHSCGVRLWIPLGVAWIPAYSASDYDPVPDPNNRTWSITLHYGLEFSRFEYPFYLSINKTIAGRPSPNPNNLYDEKRLGEWHGPDINELLNDNWIIAVGLKATVF